jgi:hypothetical protein
MRSLSGFEVVADFCEAIGKNYSGVNQQLEVKL